MTSKTTLGDVPGLVRRKSPFNCNGTLYSELRGDRLYVVYSYGRHFPVAVHDRNRELWLVNSDKYSVTTSRHQGRVREGISCSSLPLDTDQLTMFIDCRGDSANIRNSVTNELRDCVKYAPLLALATGIPLQLSA